MSANHIAFYFDPISPYAWLASTQLQRITTRTQHRLIAEPVLFAGFLKAHGHLGPAEIPAKRDYIFRDVLRRANRYGLNLEGPPQHPFNPLLSLRICTAIEDNEQRLTFALAIMQAAWGQGLDITDKAIVSRVVDACGIDAVWALQAAENADVKHALIRKTEHAVQLGMFGVPSFYVNEQIYWGDDRIEDLIHDLDCEGLSGESGREDSVYKKLDESKLAKILARESAVHRPGSRS